MFFNKYPLRIFAIDLSKIPQHYSGNMDKSKRHLIIFPLNFTISLLTLSITIGLRLVKLYKYIFSECHAYFLYRLTQRVLFKML